MSGLALYRLLTEIGAPLIHLYLARRRARGKEDTERFAERLGRPSQLRPEGSLIWLHAASVGESLSLVPLIEGMQRHWPDHRLLMTTGTVTSARLMAERLPDGVVHQYVPVDRVGYVRRFLDHWRPDLVLWAESEFWPHLVSEPARRDIPLVLVNGRMSPRSFARWQRYPRIIRRLLDGFTLCLAQTETDADRLRALGAPDTRCAGNLKFASRPLPADESALNELREAIGLRPVWLAASTHAGEEEIAGTVHTALEPGHAGLLTIIVPRHPDRGADAAAALAATGLTTARRAAGETIAPETDVYVADTIGELGLFYRLAPIAFIGKSLSADGGQNPIEAAQLGAAVVTGPKVSNFEEITRRMVTAGGAETVADADALTSAMGRLLADPELCESRAAAARTFAAGESGVVDAIVEALVPFLGPPLTPDRRAHA